MAGTAGAGESAHAERASIPSRMDDGMAAVDVTGAPRLAVIGAGSWGTALAALAVRNGVSTVLWGRNADHVAAIDRDHVNPRYLPGVELPHALRATTDLAAALA